MNGAKRASVLLYLESAIIITVQQPIQSDLKDKLQQTFHISVAHQICRFDICMVRCKKKYQTKTSKVKFSRRSLRIEKLMSVPK